MTHVAVCRVAARLACRSHETNAEKLPNLLTEARSRVTIMRSLCLIGLVASFGLMWSSTVMASETAPLRARVIEAKKIWDQAPHNAFTDLTRWRGQWVCAFREGKGHAGDVGKLRILFSADGGQWESNGLLAMNGYDLRDAALAVTPDDRLLVLGGAQQNLTSGRSTGTFVSFADQPGQYSSPQLVLSPGRWLWRVTGQHDKAYGVRYPQPVGKPFSSLHVTDDGLHYETIQAELLGEGRPSEARVRFADDGSAYCLHRRDAGDKHAYWGVSKPPYQHWKWTSTGMYFGGPNFIQLPSGHWVGGGRRHTEDGARTSLTSIDPVRGVMTPLVDLPSGGDTSYPGMVWNDGKLWMSYYASHEGKTSIYLAQITFDLD